jgi:hypothetical protein
MEQHPSILGSSPGACVLTLNLKSEEATALIRILKPTAVLPTDDHEYAAARMSFFILDRYARASDGPENWPHSGSLKRRKPGQPCRALSFLYLPVNLRGNWDLFDLGPRCVPTSDGRDHHGLYRSNVCFNRNRIDIGMRPMF